MKRFVTCAALLVLASVPVRAHAGMFGWVDDMFTFREDQKPLVTPRRALPPKVVDVPNYPPQEAAAWSAYYTQRDLQAENYRMGGGSMVMRPPATYRPNVNTAGVAASAPPTGEGWEAIENRAQANDFDEHRNIQIGDPETMAKSVDVDSSGIGVGTRIGAPVRDWREDAPKDYSDVSRPGDYDYKSPAGPVLDHALVEAPGRLGLTGRGQPIDDAADMDTDQGGSVTVQRPVGGASAWKHDPRYVGFNSKGQVTKYKVQQGDSLGGIAGQRAIYDNWKLWPLIYSANRAAIGRNPHDLDVGEKLGIPRGYSAKQAQDAMKKAGNAPR